MAQARHFPIPVRSAAPVNGKSRLRYDCLKCPGYCCSYPLIEITRRDVARLAKHFAVPYEVAEERYTKYEPQVKARALRHRKDTVYTSVCQFLDQKERRCTVYHARPGVCRDYPDSARCGYYEFIKFERAHQDDPKFVPGM